ncbi:MAG: glycosyltransferase family 8 protein [Clostridia bacterium]|nr:glycosyltransferase family 8 protein [Clostridia bacterium]
MNELNVLYATDSNYSQHAAASIYSLLKNNSCFEKINIYIIDDNISDECKEKFYILSKEFPISQIIFYPFKELSKNLKLNDKTGYAQVGYARLFLSKICDKDKILYIDCDTIVNGSLKELWETEMEDYIVAGVQDNPAFHSLEMVGMTRKHRYINGGVLLINLKKWREENAEERILQMIKDYNGFVPHHDQGIINGVFKDEIKILHPKFNTMSQFFDTKANQIKSLYDIENYYTQAELDEAVKNPAIIHYITKFYNRPWFKSCTHPLKDLYIENLKKTPFEVKLFDGELNKKIKIRKFIFNHFPFFVYSLCEKTLNIKRRKNVNTRHF